MKIVSLNIWEGHEQKALFDFLGEQKDADIFCFQEVMDSPRADISESRGARVHILDELKAFLPGWGAQFFAVQERFDLEGPVDFEVTSGQLTLRQNAIPLLAGGQIFTYEGADSPKSWEETASGFVYSRIPSGSGALTILNFHGVPEPGHKRDSSIRIEQSKRILDFIAKEKGEVILIGDFNLMPDTESIQMLEAAGLRNLIKEYGIKTTRSKASPFYGTPRQQNFADYAFVSKGIIVKKFEVPEDCVASDHLPILLEF